MLWNAKKYFWILLVLCMVMLALPHLIRYKYNGNFLFGEESYESLRIANFIHDNKFLPTEDYYSYGGRTFVYEYGWYILLSLKPDLFARVLPFLFGVLSFILFYLIVDKLYLKLRNLAGLLLLISPFFVYLFSTANKYSIAVLLSLLGIYLYVNKKENLALIVFIAVGLFSILTSLLILILFLFYSIYKKEFKGFSVLFLGSFFVFLLQFYRVLFSGLPETFFGTINWSIPSILAILFSDFGSKFGISFFLFVLAFIGIYSYLSFKFKYLLAYAAITIFILLIPYFTFLVFYLGLVFVLFSAYGLIVVINREWKSEVLKYLAVLIICCGLLFSNLAYINRISTFTPSKNFGNALVFLGNQEIGGVFSHYSRGAYLSYAGKKNFMDSNFLYAPGVEAKQLDSERLFSSNNLDVTQAIISKYNIEYIWLDRELVNNLWAGDEIELLFLLKYSPQVFKKIFDNGDVELYKYEPNWDMTNV